MGNSIDESSNSNVTQTLGSRPSGSKPMVVDCIKETLLSGLDPCFIKWLLTITKHMILLSTVPTYRNWRTILATYMGSRLLGSIPYMLVSEVLGLSSRKDNIKLWELRNLVVCQTFWPFTNTGWSNRFRACSSIIL